MRKAPPCSTPERDREMALSFAEQPGRNDANFREISDRLENVIEQVTSKYRNMQNADQDAAANEGRFRVFESLKNFNGKNLFEPWFYQIVNSAFLTAYKARKREMAREDSLDSPQNILAQKRLSNTGHKPVGDDAAFRYSEIEECCMREEEENRVHLCMHRALTSLAQKDDLKGTVAHILINNMGDLIRETGTFDYGALAELVKTESPDIIAHLAEPYQAVRRAALKVFEEIKENTSIKV